MNGIVVYESHWGNTEIVARAIAAGLGPDARAARTDEVAESDLAAADIVVVGAPVIAFGLAPEEMRAGLVDDRKAPKPADIDHPSMRGWLRRLARHGARFAAFETRIWWSPRGATGDIEKGMRKAGYRLIAKSQRFVVEGTYGPLRDGELHRARTWGTELAAAVAAEGLVSAEGLASGAVGEKGGRAA
jgi:hypothetical protein